jgi:L-methionine (R)-S-oxide reductase
MEKNSEESHKKQRYEKVENSLKTMIANYEGEYEFSRIARMASISSAIKKEFSEFTFVGFYIVEEKKDGTQFLEIGPYVSKVLATPRIALGKGVCGTTWKNKTTTIENNVKKCDNYISCSPDVLSEIVIPELKEGKVLSILDIDSNVLDYFDDIDKECLELIVKTFLPY